MRLLKEISESDPTASEPVQYSNGVTVISKKLLPQAECPIANRPVQYPDGFTCLYHRSVPTASGPVQYPSGLTSYTLFLPKALVPIHLKDKIYNLLTHR